MFNFRKAKKIVNDWAYDTKATEDRTLEIINLILNPINNTTSYWKTNLAYLESSKEITLFKSNLYSFGDVSKFLEYYKSKAFCDMEQSLTKKGLSKEQATLETMKYFMDLSHLKINNKDLIMFYQLITKLKQLELMNKIIKQEIIKKNFVPIYGNCRMMNLIRLKNGAYASIIGNPANIEELLGESGLKIKNGEEKAINYVCALEELEELLENKKIMIELNKLNR